MVGLVATTKTISLTEQIVVEERVVRYSAGSWGYVDVRFRKWIVLSLKAFTDVKWHGLGLGMEGECGETAGHGTAPA